MKNQQVFRPLLDFERQIDEAFTRYNSKTKKNLKEFKMSMDSKKTKSMKRITKLFAK